MLIVLLLVLLLVVLLVIVEASSTVHVQAMVLVTANGLVPEFCQCQQFLGIHALKIIFQIVEAFGIYLGSIFMMTMVTLLLWRINSNPEHFRHLSNTTSQGVALITI